LHRRAATHPPLTDTDVAALLETVGLAQFTKAYPHELSGGMQQRVSLVRAFALGAPILLMDEPFAALDEITRADMRYLLLDLWTRSGTTVVFVTHSVTEAVILSDRVVVMAPRPGRIAHERTIELPRPRTPEMEDGLDFLEHVRRLRADLREGHRS
jgi:NitT/TauT family transport system ATP-binding protein